ncbi:hypothetical protein [Actinokineospora sp. HUAS TT18]|uniref:hypothetical protein n=1 Tax=Actinokineospora sp. HUAS TT18 TaxID=3447451 RepID=UPI003F524A0B
MVVTSVDRTVKTLLVRLVVVLGAVVGAWLISAATAAAEEQPGVLGIVDQVLAPRSGGASGETSNSVNAAPPPAEPEPVVNAPADEVVSAPPAVNTKPAPVVVPKPVVAAPPPPVAPAPVVKQVKSPVRVPVQAHKPSPVPNQAASSPPREAEKQPAPDQPAPPGSPGGPLASSAPASSAVDTGGHARGMAGMPASHDPLSPLAYAGIPGPRVDDLPGRDAGLPASSPD